MEYTRLPQEPGNVSDGEAAPPSGWPRSGELEFDHVTAVYRPGLPPVLKDISFKLGVREVEQLWSLGPLLKDSH